MKILSVLNARSESRAAGEGRLAPEDAVWPAGITSISFVIAAPENADDHIVAYAIDAGGTGALLYTLEGSFAELMTTIGAAIVRFGSPSPSAHQSPVGRGPLPPPPPPGAPGPDALPVILAMANLQQGVVQRLGPILEGMPVPARDRADHRHALAK